MSYALPENAGLRISGVGSIRRTDLVIEQPVISNLPMEYVGVTPKVKRTTVMDTRPGRRAIPLHAVADGAEPGGKLTILSVPGPILAMLMLGQESTLATVAGTVAAAEAHRFVSGYDFQLAHDNIGTLLLAGGTKAVLVSGTSTASVTFTAVTAGAAGNSITVALIDTAGATHALTVSVVGLAITVALKVTGDTPVSTAAEVAAAVNASPAAAALVVATPTDATGAGVVVAAAATNLATGADTGTPWTLGTDYAITDALEGQIRVIPGGLGGALNATGTVLATYHYGAIAGQTIIVGTNSQIEAEVRFRGTNDLMNEAGVSGGARRFFAARLILTPNGEINLADPNPVKATFDAIPLAPASGNAVEIQAPVYATVA
jgi:hypothetical protein